MQCQTSQSQRAIKLVDTINNRLVIDTNVALDLWLFKRPGLDALRRHMAVQKPLATATMRGELAMVLARSVTGAGSIASHWLDEGRSQKVLVEWDRHMDVVELPTGSHSKWPCCPDPDDQKFIDLALAQGAGWLLTRDKHLLRMRRVCQRWGLMVAPPEAVPSISTHDHLGS
jgi:uncharacterized protein